MPKILIIEDDAILRMAFRAKLELEGFEIAEAADGREGLAMSAEFKPDLIILDILMPKMSGIDFLKEYQPKKLHPETKIIVFSNWTLPEKMREAAALGADKYLTKASISPNKLIEVVKETLA